MEDRSYYNWNFIAAERENEFVFDGVEEMFLYSTSSLIYLSVEIKFMVVVCEFGVTLCFSSKPVA